MACTRTLKIALIALALLAGLLIVDMTSQARERGFSTVAGDPISKSFNRAKVKQLRQHRRSLRNQRRHLRHRHTGRRSLHDTLFLIDGTELLTERNSEAAIRRNSHLRNKVSVMRRRPGSKIIRVSEKMKRLGEARAAIREEKILKEIDNIDIRFYRDNEAYDARYPSIVYLELLEK